MPVQGAGEVGRFLGGVGFEVVDGSGGNGEVGTLSAAASLGIIGGSFIRQGPPGDNLGLGEDG